ncbi:MAG: tRNA (adenosine(37)-N6)-threonylcarbamoyltransferase complex ATPase subunit type 1 TsaE [Actinomycetota bacterium]|nr:MAG: tRNA (adenosine(37)-N6)-threonylcarbamoyltransferase complex ATPase subunit type 1 TsaE [Actinomycetota bacterium]
MEALLEAPTAEDTRAIGSALADLLRPGDALALTGELGAGKTTLVQGIARGLGYAGAVVSPTFTLVREYRGRLRLYHVDVYRLERVQDAIDLAFEEMLDGDGVLVVEWGDAVEQLLPPEHLLVELTVPGPDERRRIALTGIGPSWAARWERLERAVQRWGLAA